MSAAGPTAFVFAGGGSLGVIQVGMLKALLVRGIVPDVVVGASVGAINAAYFAGNPSLDGVAALEAIWRNLKREDIFPLSPVGGLWRLLSQRNHMVTADSLARLLESKLTFTRIEEGQLPCWIIATDMLTGTEVRLSSGPVVPALLASAAIPGVFPPVRLNGHHLIDGGVASHAPCTAAVELGAKRIYVLPTGYSCTMEAPPRSAVGILLHGINLLIAGQLTSEVRRLNSVVDVRVVPPLCPLSVQPYDFSQAGDLMARAEASTQKWLEIGAELVDGVPHQLPPHRHDGAPDPYGTVAR